MSTPKNTPLDRLKYHVSGAIERGEKTAIEAIVAPKHTPGPWKCSPLDRKQTYVVNEAKALPQQAVYSTDEVLANARLIAAAPELLEALKLAVAYFECHANTAGEIKTRDLMIDVISKATSQPKTR